GGSAPCDASRSTPRWRCCPRARLRPRAANRTRSGEAERQVVSITDACEGASRGEHRSVTLEGRLDDFQQTVRVEWDCIDPNLEGEDGCACRARGERPGAASMLSIVLLALARRRRSFARSFARST